LLEVASSCKARPLSSSRFSSSSRVGLAVSNSLEASSRVSQKLADRSAGMDLGVKMPKVVNVHANILTTTNNKIAARAPNKGLHTVLRLRLGQTQNRAPSSNEVIATE